MPGGTGIGSGRGIYVCRKCGYTEKSGGRSSHNCPKCGISMIRKLGSGKKLFSSSKTKVFISEADCIKCGKCISICHHKALKMGDNSAELIKSRCVGCLACVSVCPTNAIRPE